jgi:integrase
VALTEIMRRKVKTGATRSCPRAAPSQPIALCALSGFFAWARSGYIEAANPTSDIKPLHEQDRTRVPSEAELVDIWLTCGDDAFGRIIKLLALTGQGRQEIGHLEWSDFS